METMRNSKGAVTRADLRAAVYDSCTGLARRDASELVDLVLEEIAEALVSGESVKLSGFGAFKVRSKRPRVGRNPKTKTPAPIVARRVLTFKAAPGLIARINQSPDANRVAAPRRRSASDLGAHPIKAPQLL